MASPQFSDMKSHPAYESFTIAELRADLQRIEEQITYGKANGAEHLWLTWILQERSLCEAELKRRVIANPAQPEFWPELISAKDLLALPPDPTRWIWDMTLPFGGTSVLVSKPKVGKSTFAVNLALAVSRGRPFLDRQTQACAVAYLSLDASLPEIVETFTHFGLRDTDPIFLHAGAAPQDAVAWIMQRVKENNVKLAIVDTLQRLFRFKDVNDYSGVTNAVEPLLDAARTQNCHVLFAHHAKKDAGDDLDSAIGSTAIRGLAYSYLHLKRLPDSERRILRSDQRGGKNFSECALGFGKDGWLERQGSREDAEVEEAAPKILEILGDEDGELNERDIRKAVPMRGWIVGRALRELHKRGEVERLGAGKRGDPFRYSLSLSLSSLLKREKGATEPGLETEKSKLPLTLQGEMLVPKFQDGNGTSVDKKKNGDTAGLESVGWEEVG